MYVIFDFLVFALEIYSLILIIRSLMSWFPNLDYSNPFVRLMYDITEPVLGPIRRAVPPTGGMDWSLLIAVIGLRVIIVLLSRF
jgi:YggT family protein